MFTAEESMDNPFEVFNLALDKKGTDLWLRDNIHDEVVMNVSELKQDFIRVMKADRILSMNEEMVDHPAHYNTGKYEVIEVLEDNLTEDQFEGFLLGNALKYIMRCQTKGNTVQDIKKANWYLNRLADFIEKQEEEEIPF